MMGIDVQLQRGYELLLEMVRSISEDCAEDIERVRREGARDAMTRQAFQDLLSRCIDEACLGARRRGDIETADRLETTKEQIMEEVSQSRERGGLRSGQGPDSARQELTLRSHKGVEPHPVRPSPVFHSRPVTVNEGFVDVHDIRLWGENQRLKIHVGQFENTHGRKPTPDDLIRIMKSEANLPGVDERDQFKIADLARSIASSGVRQPPVIAYDGTLLDGNRRVAASLHVLASDDFSPEEKARARMVRVWQLTEHATRDEQDAVVVSLNFEPDYKEDWPEYVKGRILYDEWRAALQNEEHPGVARQKELRKELARRFAITTDRFNRYVQMVELSDEFEEHARTKRGKDAHEAQHRADEYFQYFDELGKGRSPGGVNWSLNQDETFKGLVFDLLYDRKFHNWKAIRDLKYVYQNDEATEFLREANKVDDLDQAQELVDNGLSAGRTARAAERRVGANKRIEIFVKWLREVPVNIFSLGSPGAITEKNLRELYAALKLVEVHVPDALRRDDGSSGTQS